MDDFDDMFNELDTVPKNDEPNKDSYKKNNNYNDYKKNFNKPKYTNVEGKQTINVWNNDKVTPVELDLENMSSSTKWATISLPSKTYKLDQDDYNRFNDIIKYLKANNFKIRVVCSNVKAIHKSLVNAFGDDIIRVTPWKGYCKEQKEYTQYLASDSNIQAACHYFKGFHNFPASIKLIKAASIGSLVGSDNNELSTLVIVHDRNYNGKKIDFQKSQLAGDYYMLSKQLSLNLFNIANDSDFLSLKTILKDNAKKDTEK